MFDDDDNKSLGFREFLCCFSVLLRGTIEEKVDLFIKMHDVEKKGYFYKNEVEKTIEDVCSLLKLSFPPSYFTDNDIFNVQTKLKKRFAKYEVVTYFDFKILYELPEIKKCSFNL